MISHATFGVNQVNSLGAMAASVFSTQSCFSSFISGTIKLVTEIDLRVPTNVSELDTVPKYRGTWIFVKPCYATLNNRQL